MKRPTSLSVVSILLMVIGGLAFLNAFSTMRAMDDPEFIEMAEKMGAISSTPKPVQIAMAFLGSLVVLVSGVAIYKRHGWGRWLYVGWTLLMMLVTLVTTPRMLVFMIPGVVFTAIIAFFLFRPAASAYFRGEEHVIDAPSA